MCRLVEDGQLLEVRFADKKRKDNIPLSMIPPGLLCGIKGNTVNSQTDKFEVNNMVMNQQMTMMMLMQQ